MKREPKQILESGGYLRDRFSFWRRFGFHWPYIPEYAVGEAEPGLAEGYLQSNVAIHLDWADRLRLLVSGNMVVMLKVQTDVAVSKMRSAVAHGILAPGEPLPMSTAEQRPQVAPPRESPQG
jgi:hypothetical protein